MKSRKERLIEFITEDIDNHVFMEREEKELNELIIYLQTGTLSDTWEDNDYIIRAINNLQEVCMEFGVN